MFYTTDLYQEAGVTDRDQRYIIYYLNPSIRRDVQPEDNYQQDQETQSPPEEEEFLGPAFEDCGPNRGGDVGQRPRGGGDCGGDVEDTSRDQTQM